MTISRQHGSSAGRRFDVIVIGVGSVGALTCWQLARRGASVLGLDRFSIPNTRASYNGDTRVFRMAYFEHPDYVPLLQRAYRLWKQLERESDETLYVETGGLYIGAAESELIAGTIRAAQQHGLEHEVLDHAALKSRYPQFTLPGDFIGVHEPKAGALLSERIVAAAARSATKRGAALQGCEPACDWSADDAGVTVRTERETYHADRLIICAGAWSAPLLGRLGIQITVTRQVICWFQPRDPNAFDSRHFPIWGLETPERFHYGFPLAGDQPGVKLSHHTPGPVANVDTLEQPPTAEEIESVRSIARRFLPAADGPLLSTRVCIYGNSPDGHYIIDQHPESERVQVAAGLSGHGFKSSSALAQILADRALTGGTDLPADFLSLKRFST